MNNEEIEVLKEWVKDQYNSGNIDEDVLYLLTKLIIEKENELNTPIKDIVIPTPTVSPSIPTYPWWDPYRVVYSNGAAVKTDGGSGVELPEELKYTTTTTKN